MNNFLALYIHIPFCRRLCPYCDFHKVEAGPNGIPEPLYLQRLIEQLEQEVEHWNLSGRSLVSCYFGGGSPSLLRPDFFAAFLQKVQSIFVTNDRFEVTMEGNPDDLSYQQLQQLNMSGVNRLSLGVQSFQPKILAALGRTHSPQKARQALQWAKTMGFPSLNIDLIFGVAGQSLDLLEKDLEEIVRLDPQHISAYQLTVEPATPLASSVKSGKTVLPPEEEVVAMYHQIPQMLGEQGWPRYEISNYAKPGLESRHNLQYWRYGEFLGLGSGAVSFLRHWKLEIGNFKLENTVYGKRWRTTRNLKKYLAGDWAYEEKEEIDLKTARGEFCMMGLRLAEGMDHQKFQENFGAPFSHYYSALYQHAIQQKWLIDEGDRLKLTEEGLLFSNQLFQELF